MAFDRHRYPRDWEAIRKQVGERSGWQCEGSPLYPRCRAEHGKPHPATGSKVVLTVAHYPDPDTKIGDLSGLLHLCQRCHLALDRPHHLAKQRRNREAKRLAAQPRLPLEEKR